MASTADGKCSKDCDLTRLHSSCTAVATDSTYAEAQLPLRSRACCLCSRRQLLSLQSCCTQATSWYYTGAHLAGAAGGDRRRRVSALTVRRCRCDGALRRALPQHRAHLVRNLQHPVLDQHNNFELPLNLTSVGEPRAESCGSASNAVANNEAACTKESPCKYDCRQVWRHDSTPNSARTGGGRAAAGGCRTARTCRAPRLQGWW